MGTLVCTDDRRGMMPHVDICEAISQLLADLGETAEEVASTLEANGIRGVRNAVRILNPIVRYVQSNVHADRLDLMKRDKLTVTLDRQQQEVLLPQAVRDFTTGFDSGRYPGLELGPE